MYGLVNKAIEDLAVSLGGEAGWEAVHRRAGIDVVAFIQSETYDDEVTTRLVAAAADVLGVTEEEVLRAFGRHWILYTARQGYGPLVHAFGDCLADLVANLDQLHARIKLSFPLARPPRFSHEVEADGTIAVTYRSEREGLAPMVVGLLEGAAEAFGETVEIGVRSRRTPGATAGDTGGDTAGDTAGDMAGDMVDVFTVRPGRRVPP